MRIAFHVPRASHLTPGPSGDKVLVHNLLVSLRGRGHEVKVVSYVNVRDFWRGRVPARRLVSEALSIRREMRRFSPDAWLVYDARVTNPDLFGWWQRPKRYVLINTGAGTGRNLPRRWRWLFTFAHRRSLARADRIAAARPPHADQLRSLGVTEDRLRLLPVAAETWDWMPSQQEARRRLRLPQEATIILCVTRLPALQGDGKHPGKTEAVLELLAAMTELPTESLLLLVGDGPGRSQVECDITGLKLEGRVRLAGSVPHDDVRWFYAACDFYAFPDPGDRAFAAIVEAQAAGRPVAAMQTRSDQLVIDEGRTGLLAKDLQEFRVHIAILARDRARCESMGQSAREYIVQSHSLDSRVRQIEAMLVGEEMLHPSHIR